MAYRASLYPFRFRRLNSSSVVAVSESGDHEFLETEELRSLVQAPETLSLDRLAELKSKFFVGDPSASGTMRLLASRIATRQEAVLSGPALHILVPPTLRCTHSCRYCQVNRSLETEGFTMSLEDLDAACDTIFQSPSPTLTVEFQGGEPLLRFDLVHRAIERIVAKNESHHRRIRFVICSTLHQLDPDTCAFFKGHEVDYSVIDFCAFYERVFDRVLYWNMQGIPIREVTASIALNKILSPFDAGYVDLQSPMGAGLAVLVYNYDGYVYE